MLKLPKDVVADPRHDAVVKLLTTGAAPLWERGQNPVVTVPMSDVLAAELRGAIAAGQAFQGLELIAEKLAAEQKGLAAVAQKTPESPQNARISRVLFLASDGSTRFYRDADALLTHHAARVLGCRLDLAGEALGAAIFGTPRLVRSVLIFDKKVAARVLLSLLPR